MTKHKTVSKWSELIKLIENMNPYRKTIILSGFINKIDGKGKTKIDKLMFVERNVEILEVE